MTEILWTDAIRQRVWQGAGLESTAFDTQTRGKHRKSVFAYYTVMRDWWMKAAADESTRALLSALDERVKSRARAVQNAPLVLDQEALLYTLGRRAEGFGDTEKVTELFAERAIRRWVAVEGPVFALQALLRAADFRFSYKSYTPAYRKKRLVAPKNLNEPALEQGPGIAAITITGRSRTNPMRSMGSNWLAPFLILRRTFGLADDTQRAAGLAHAQSLNAPSDALRIGIALVFPELAGPLLKELLARDETPPSAFLLAASLTDLEQVRSLLEAAEGEDPLYQLTPTAPTLVARFGAAAESLLARMAERIEAQVKFKSDLLRLLTPLFRALPTETAVARAVAEGGWKYSDFPGTNLMVHKSWSVPLMLGKPLSVDQMLKREYVRQALEKMIADDREAMLAVRTELGGHPLLDELLGAAEEQADTLDLPAALQPGPARTKDMPWCWKPTRLPDVHLSDGSPLPLPAIERLGDVLREAEGTLSADLEEVKKSCDSSSLAAFSWALFEAWAGRTKDRWILGALRHIGPDDTPTRLRPWILNTWMRKSLFARSVQGLELLADMATDAALLQLHLIGLRTSSSALRSRARTQLERAAKTRGLTGDALAERLIPDLGLSGAGHTTLSFGATTIRIDLDHQLKPTATVGEAKPKRSLPKPAEGDDARKVKAAKAAFSALKKDLKQLAPGLIQQLERRMVQRAGWPLQAARLSVFQKPLLLALATRLVWLDEGGAAFTVDATGATVGHDGAACSPSGTVRIAHPIDLDAKSLKAWKKWLGRNKQPFDQIKRAVLTVSADSVEQSTAATLSGSDLRQLIRRGWERGPAEDNGIFHFLARGAGTVRLVLPIEPGASTSGLDSAAEQSTGPLQALPRGTWRGTGQPLSSVDPLLLSESLVDLKELG